jgi:hypothetical protein
VARDTIKVERYYGNTNLETIMEKLVLMRFSNFKIRGEENKNPYYNICTNLAEISEKENKV